MRAKGLLVVAAAVAGCAVAANDFEVSRYNSTVLPR